MAASHRSRLALHEAGFLDRELRHDSLLLQAAMVYHLTPQHSAPPLPALLLPGKGAELRVRTWLWMLVLGHGRARAGGRTQFGRRSVRSLPCMHPEVDARRCSRTFDRLVEAGRLSTRGTLYRETAGCDGEFDWTVTRVPPRYSHEWAHREPYPLTRFEMPFALWANHWVDRLEPATVCTLFAVRHMCPDSEVWFRVPRVIKDRYALSSKLWNRGLLALYNYRLIDVVTNDDQVPQRWIRPHWDTLSRPPSTRRRKPYRVVADPSTLNARIPLQPGRTSVVGEAIRKQRVQHQVEILAAVERNDEPTIRRLAEIVHCFGSGDLLDAGRVTRLLHPPRAVGRERSYVTAALELLAAAGLLTTVEPPAHHAVPIRRYRLADEGPASASATGRPA